MFIDDVLKEFSDGNTYYLFDKRSNCEVLEQETINEGRWTRRVRVVAERNGEFVAVEYDEGLTEYQDVDDIAFEVYKVAPAVVTITKYVKV